MLSPTEAFTLLPNEQRLLASPPRITLSLQTLNKFPGKEPLSISSANGRVYLTNRRVRFHTTMPIPDLILKTPQNS